MYLWTALAVGFLGSVHCIGMCGPIALALPGSDHSISFIIERVLYNAGRIITYTLLGAIFGLVGNIISLAGWQGPLSIFLGVAIVVAALVPRHYRSSISSLPLIKPLLERLKKLLPRFMKMHSKSALLATGILNGFLPCGFVYVGLAGAISTGTTLSAMAYMALFGLGTFPAMFLVSMGPRIFSGTVRAKIQRITPYLAVLVGVLLIIRGMGLGIPFVSPNISGVGMSMH